MILRSEESDGEEMTPHQRSSISARSAGREVTFDPEQTSSRACPSYSVIERAGKLNKGLNPCSLIRDPSLGGQAIGHPA
jgi:hypothetical protein